MAPYILKFPQVRNSTMIVSEDVVDAYFPGMDRFLGKRMSPTAIGVVKKGDTVEFWTEGVLEMTVGKIRIQKGYGEGMILYLDEFQRKILEDHRVEEFRTLNRSKEKWSDMDWLIEESYFQEY